MSDRIEYREIPKGHLFSPEEAAARRLWAQHWIGLFAGVARAAGYGVFQGGTLVRNIDVIAVPWRASLEHKSSDLFVLSLVHSMGITMGNCGETFYGNRWYALWDKHHPDHQIDLKVIRARPPEAKESGKL